MTAACHRRVSSASSMGTTVDIKSTIHEVDRSVQMALHEDARRLQMLRERVNSLYSNTMSSPQNRRPQPSPQSLPPSRALRESTPPVIPRPPWTQLHRLSESLGRMERYGDENSCTAGAEGLPRKLFDTSCRSPAGAQQQRPAKPGCLQARLASVLDMAASPSPARPSHASPLHAVAHLPPARDSSDSRQSFSPRPAFGSPIEGGEPPKWQDIRPPSGPQASVRQRPSALVDRPGDGTHHSHPIRPAAPGSESSSEGTNADYEGTAQRRVLSSGNSLASQAVQSRRASWGTAISWQSANTTSDSLMAPLLPAGDIAASVSSLDSELLQPEDEQQANLQEWLAEVEGRLLSRLSEFQQLRRELMAQSHQASMGRWQRPPEGCSRPGPPPRPCQALSADGPGEDPGVTVCELLIADDH